VRSDPQPGHRKKGSLAMMRMAGEGISRRTRDGVKVTIASTGIERYPPVQSFIIRPFHRLPVFLPGDTAPEFRVEGMPVLQHLIPEIKKDCHASVSSSGGNFASISFHVSVALKIFGLLSFEKSSIHVRVFPGMSNCGSQIASDRRTSISVGES